jgi:hypothetical protein
MDTWKSNHEVINSNEWPVFVRQEVRGEGTHQVSLLVSLEQVNKNWSLPNNWEVSLSESDGRVIMSQRFCLNVDSFSHENAQKQADTIVSSYQD